MIVEPEPTTVTDKSVETFNEFINHLEEIVRDEYSILKLPHSQSVANDYATFLLNTVDRTRWFALRNLIELESLWGAIRNPQGGNDVNEESNDGSLHVYILTNIMRRMSVRYTNITNTINEYIVPMLANSIVKVFPTTEPDSNDGLVFYDKFVETTLSEDTLTKVFEKNHWLVYLMTINFLPKPLLIDCLYTQEEQ